jgi:hypothetical protein
MNIPFILNLKQSPNAMNLEGMLLPLIYSFFHQLLTPKG